MSNAKYVAAYRDREKAKRERMVAALQSIITELSGNEKPMAVRIRAIAQEALG